MSDQNTKDVWKKWFPKKIKKNKLLGQINQSNDNDMILQKVYFDKGFKLGVKEGYQLKLKKKEFIFYNEKTKLKNKMKGFLKTLNCALKDLDTTIVNKLLEIVLKISSKIFYNSDQVNKSVIIKNIQVMLQETIVSKKIIFKIHIDDKKVFESYFGALLSSYNYVVHCDQRVQPGECIIDLENMTLDSTKFTRWQELCRLFCNRELL